MISAHFIINNSSSSEVRNNRLAGVTCQERSSIRIVSAGNHHRLPDTSGDKGHLHVGDSGDDGDDGNDDVLIDPANREWPQCRNMREKKHRSQIVCVLSEL